MINYKENINKISLFDETVTKTYNLNSSCRNLVNESYEVIKQYFNE